MDELIDILDSKGNYTGETKLKSYAHRMGLFHPTVHIWFYTASGELLIQQRGKNKEIHPLLWDVSVAGHAGAGESIEVSAVREVEEEIGLKIPANQLLKIGVFKSVQKHNDDLIDCEFHHTYISILNVDLNELKKQKSEVEKLVLIDMNQFEKEVFENSQTGKYVPHQLSYYKTVIEAIKKAIDSKQNPQQN